MNGMLRAFFGPIRRGAGGMRWRRVGMAYVCLAIVCLGGVRGQGNPGGAEPPDESPAARRSSEDADRILNMRRLLDTDRQQKAKLELELRELDAEFEEAAGEFERLDAELTAALSRHDAATDEEERSRLAQQVERLRASRAAKRTRFEMVIDRRKAVQQQIVTLTEKLAIEQEYLDRLMSPPTAAPITGEPVVAPASPAPAGDAGPLGLASPATPPQASDEVGPDELDEELRAARKDRQLKAAVLREQQDRVKRLDRAIEVFERDLVSSQELLKLAKEAAEQEEATLRDLTARVEERRGAGETGEEILALVTEQEEARTRAEEAKAEVVTQSERIAKSETTLARLKKSRDEALRAVVEAEADLRAADRLVWFLSSPVAPYRVSWWVTNKGPRVVITILGAVALYWIAKRLAGRVLGDVLKRSGGGDAAAREGRAETLRRVIDSTAGVVIVVLGVLTALNQAGVNVTVLLGGAAVVGAAIAFGSQNLIKDYFAGFMILMENQYSVGNVVKIGAVTGTVENITLRMTSLRDLEGVLHFIPHSQVLSVSNLTYGWSRIVLDIKVNVNEDPDKVMGLIMGVANELQRDAELGPQILGDPEMLGVDQLAGASMVIKVLVKTKPLHRWPIKREMLRRIKKAFDAAGVKMA